MDDVTAWIDEQLAEIEELKKDVSKWQTDLKKEARSWRDAMLRDLNNWKYEMEDEIEALKGEAKNGYKGTTGESTGSEDLLGSSTGESDQAETDDTSGRKRRGRSSGTK